ncbi:hypothetical protein F2P56_013147 [Juglans regia]|uniref:LOB domain-containing protein 41-like n=2 Tax=Juglans regia TaxID=51240 RepID=A0A2I4FEJ7_JUGRE|nr:LOB domain-containing protein 41-like [Juglans regia]KAF5469047.1 hypothetical protein F2P56_013147 [Juglans regia]
MRMSCNGCRVLRKGCGEDCTIRPCLQWIRTPESQANATVFLAKFYGRAGLINLINAGPEHHRPEIFKSLLYEACGRVVSPIYGSTGLFSSGSWNLCHDAVEAVLRGAPIMKVLSESVVNPPVQACDIRHVVKPAPSDQLHKVKKSRSKVKSSVVKPQPKAKPEVDSASIQSPGNSGSDRQLWCDNDLGVSVSRNPSPGGNSTETDCISAETVEASLFAKPDEQADGCSDVDLELTLAFGNSEHVKREEQNNGYDNDTCKKLVGSQAA